MTKLIFILGQNKIKSWSGMLDLRIYIFKSQVKTGQQTHGYNKINPFISNCINFVARYLPSPKQSFIDTFVIHAEDSLFYISSNNWI